MHDSAPSSEPFLKLDRCPYCHEDVDRTAQESVVCQKCHALEHKACWEEAGGKCAACGHDTHLTAQQADELELGPIQNRFGHQAPPAPVSAEEARRGTAELFVDSPGSGIPDWLLGALTLGIGTIHGAESRFAQHSERNANTLGRLPDGGGIDEELRPRLERSRARLGRRASLSLRSGLTIVLSLASGLLVMAGLGDPDFLPGLVFGGLAFAVIQSVHLVLFRAAVRRHEHDQLFVSLVESAVPPAPAKALLDKFDLRWSDRARGDLGISAVGWLLPFVSFVLLPILLAARLRGQLEQHEKHEQEAEELAALYRRAVTDKDPVELEDDDLSEIPGPPVEHDAELEDPVLDLDG